MLKSFCVLFFLFGMTLLRSFGSDSDTDDASEISDKALQLTLHEIRLPGAPLNQLISQKNLTINSYFDVVLENIKDSIKWDMGISHLSQIDFSPQYLNHIQLHILSAIIESQRFEKKSAFIEESENLFFAKQQNLIERMGKLFASKFVSSFNNVFIACDIKPILQSFIHKEHPFQGFLTQEWPLLVKSLKEEAFIDQAEQKVFLAALRQIHPITKEWRLLANYYVNKGYNQESLIALLETTPDLSIANTLKILTTMVKGLEKSDFLSTYVMGCIRKGEMNAKEISSYAFPLLLFNRLSPSDWIALWDNTMSVPMIPTSLKMPNGSVLTFKEKDNEYNADLAQKCKKQFQIDRIFGTSLDFGFVIENPNQICKLTSSLKKNLRALKGIEFYPYACQMLCHQIVKVKKTFTTDMSLLNYLTMQVPIPLNLCRDILHQWEKYLNPPSVSLSMNQMDGLMEKSYNLKDFAFLNNLIQRTNFFSSELKLKGHIISFVASRENSGKGADEPDTLDYFKGNQYPSLSLLIPELKRRGYDGEVLNWEDPGIEWHKRDCLFVGHVWGYTQNQNAFYEWLQMVRSYHIPLVNSYDFVEWNINKSYLADLQKAKIPVIPTWIIPPTSKTTLENILGQANTLWGTKNIIAKGVVDAGGNGYKHYDPNDHKAMADHIDFLKAQKRGAVIQPFWPEVSQMGELSFVFIGSALSHSYLKVCALGSELVQVLYQGRSYHLNKTDLSSKIDEFVKRLKNFRHDLKITPENLISAHGQIHLLFYKLKNFFALKNIPVPPLVRIDCIMAKDQLSIMEIEGIPYLEMKEAMNHDLNKQVVKWYVDEVIRQWNITKVQKTLNFKK